MARKRANGEGSITKRKNGTWEGKITIGYHPESGKPIRKSFYGRTQKEVRDKMTAFRAKQDSTIIPDAGDPEMALNEWLDTWLEDYLQDIKPGTKVAYASVCSNHIRPALGKIPLSSLKAPAIQKFYNQLREKGLSPKYIKNIHGVLHRALDMAVKVEYVGKNYTSVCTIPKGEAQEIHPLDVPEQKRLFAAIKGEEHEDMILTDTFTGLRCGELIGLTWDCIDFDNGIIRVRRQLVQTRQKGAVYSFGSLKNGKTRTLTPAPFVFDVLKRHKAKQNEMKEAAGELWNEGDFPNLVFTHKDGSHLSQPTVWKEFQKLLKKADLQHHRLHDLRHTFAVNSLIAGDDIKTLQENMGHYSAAFTLDRYGHVTETMHRESANRMQAFIDSMDDDPENKK